MSFLCSPATLASGALIAVAACSSIDGDAGTSAEPELGSARAALTAPPARAADAADTHPHGKAAVDSAGGPVLRRALAARSVDIAYGKDGSQYVAGGFSGHVRIGARELTALDHIDGFVARSRGGRVLWVHHFGNDFDQQVTDIEVLHDGSSLIAGVFEGRLELGEYSLLASGRRYERSAFVAELGPEGRVRSARTVVHGLPIGADVALTLAPGGAAQIVVPVDEHTRAADGSPLGTSPVATFDVNGLELTSSVDIDVVCLPDPTFDICLVQNSMGAPACINGGKAAQTCLNTIVCPDPFTTCCQSEGATSFGAACVEEVLGNCSPTLCQCLPVSQLESVNPGTALPAQDLDCGALVAHVCCLDPYCCEYAWDSICADEAQAVSSAACSAP